VKKQAVRMMGCSDTPQGAMWFWGMLTPRKVAFAAALALADGLPGFPPAQMLACWYIVRNSLSAALRRLAFECP
jgi:hypothetical protein